VFLPRGKETDAAVLVGRTLLAQGNEGAGIFDAQRFDEKPIIEWVNGLCASTTVYARFFGTFTIFETDSDPVKEKRWLRVGSHGW